jgi:hypothetical protein
MRRQADFPATLFLCDLIRVEMGQMKMDQVRSKWGKGEYEGLDGEWARECVEMRGLALPDGPRHSGKPRARSGLGHMASVANAGLLL